jgi:hypothetical protein
MLATSGTVSETLTANGYGRGMAPLRNSQYERFLVLLILDQLKPADAYRRAGFTANNPAVARAGIARLLARPDVRLRKNELEAEIARGKVQGRIDDCRSERDEKAEAVRDLRLAIEMAFQLKKPGDVGELWKKIGTLRGWWVEQTATLATVSDLRAADDQTLLATLFGGAPPTLEQRQTALATLLDRRRQVIEHKPADASDSDASG